MFYKFDPCVLCNVVSEEYTYIYMTAIRKDELAWLHAHKNNGNIKYFPVWKRSVSMTVTESDSFQCCYMFLPIIMGIGKVFLNWNKAVAALQFPTSLKVRSANTLTIWNVPISFMKSITIIWSQISQHPDSNSILWNMDSFFHPSEMRDFWIYRWWKTSCTTNWFVRGYEVKAAQFISLRDFLLGK